MAAVAAQFSATPAIPTKSNTLSKSLTRAAFQGHTFSFEAGRRQHLKNFNGLRSGSEVSRDIQCIFSTGCFWRGSNLEGRGLPNLVAKRRATFVVYAAMRGKQLEGRKLRVAVVGGGPAGGSTAETLAKGGVETFLFERKLDNCKPCGGAIPLCMVGEFDIPLDIIDRRVTKMKMISPSNVAVDVGRTLKENEYIGMVRREVLDSFLRERAAKNGATVINGLFMKMDLPKDSDSPYVLHYNSYDPNTIQGKPCTLEVDAVVGADGANSRVAKSIDAGEYEYAIAFQERIRIPEDKMAYYENLAQCWMACLGSKRVSKSTHTVKRRKCRRTPSAKPTSAATMSTHRSKNSNDFKQHSIEGAHKLKNQKRQGDYSAGGYGGVNRHSQKQQPKAAESLTVLEKSFPRKNLDPETVQYYTEISSLLEKSTTNTEERAILCSNALDESQGKELQLVCDKIFSRLFENLISSCERDQLCQFLSRCIKVFPSIAIDQSGSHVAEAALKSLALALQDCDANAEIHAVIEDVLTKICQEVAKNVINIMCNQYGSHVLRSLLCLCNGTLLESLDKFHMRNPASTLASRLSGFSFELPTKQPNQARLQAFPNLLKFTVSKVLEYSRDSISVIRADTFGGLVFQTILRLLKGDNEAVVKVITALLDCGEKNVLKEGKMLEDASRQNVLDLMMDPSSSHLMEVILEVAPGYLYMEILNRFFRHSLFEIATHKSGNFVVQSLISSSRDEGQVNMICGELASKFPELLKGRKSGVVASLIAACRRFHTHERECCRALAHAVNFDCASPNCIVPRILHLEHFSCSARGSDWQWPSGSKMSVLGCLMLQNIFSYPNDFIQQFCSSFASMEIDHILVAAKDPGGSRVIEAFLSSKAPLKHKLRVISKFRGHFGELAQQPSSSFTVSKCFLAADVALKEVIASELTLVQAELSRLKHGPHLLKICDITRYSKGPEQWRSSQSSKQSTRQAFTEVFGSEGEARQQDDNALMSFDEGMMEVPSMKGKNKRTRGLDNTRSEMDNTSLNELGASKLEHSMAVLGFDMHKQAKTKDANGKSGYENESDSHRVKMTSIKPFILEGDSMETTGKDNIEEIFCKKVKTNKSNKGMKVNEVRTNLVNIVPDQDSIDPSLHNVLNILEKGSKKERAHINNPSTSSVKKQKRGKQMLYM